MEAFEKTVLRTMVQQWIWAVSFHRPEGEVDALFEGISRPTWGYTDIECDRNIFEIHVGGEKSVNSVS
jgi:hypothetical protein